MSLLRSLFDRKGTPLLMAAGLLLFVAERRWRLRRPTRPPVRRMVVNSLVALPAFTLLRLLLLPTMVRLAQENRRWGLGLQPLLPGGPLARGIITFLVLDFSNYLWHILLHKWPLLWRFHLVHHSDRDLDLTTAFRFHFGELIGSVFYRGAWVVATGATPVQLLVYEIFFEGATQFHHSNVRLPDRVERALQLVLMTPRMHGIHHSVVQDEADSNYAVIFSFWDRLGRTLRLDVPDDTLVIGAPGHRPEDLTVGQLWRLPFRRVVNGE